MAVERPRRRTRDARRQAKYTAAAVRFSGGFWGASVIRSGGAKGEEPTDAIRGLSRSASFGEEAGGSCWVVVEEAGEVFDALAGLGHPVGDGGFPGEVVGGLLV